MRVTGPRWGESRLLMTSGGEEDSEGIDGLDEVEGVDAFPI